MSSLSKTKTLFGFTSPRTLEKIAPEIKILTDNFSGETWSGNNELQADFFQKLFDSPYYEGETFPGDPAFAARDRITRAPKALGFVDLQPTIRLTEAGQKLLENKRADEVYTKQLMKFQLPSPYHTQSTQITFNVRPYLELLRMIKDLDGISKTEIALFFLQLTNIDKYDALTEKVRAFRTGSSSFTGSRKTYVHQCFEEEVRTIFADEIAANDTHVRESGSTNLNDFIKTKKSNLIDYADAFSRYIRATGLVTFQRGTYRLIISEQKTEEVDLLLQNLDRSAGAYTSAAQYKEYLFSTSNVQLLSDNKDLLVQKIVRLAPQDVAELQSKDTEALKDVLAEVTSHIKEQNVQAQTQRLRTYEELPDIEAVFDQILNREVPDPPLFLEWNTWRCFAMLGNALDVKGNFVVDTDGMPINYAPGNKPDIEIEYEDFGIITEVTMSRGNTQYNMEGESVPRHFGKAKEASGKELYCFFVAPSISEGALAHFFNLNRMETRLYGGKTKIIPMQLDKFVEFVQAGVAGRFSDTGKLKNWLEARWLSNQTVSDEVVWYKEITESVSTWLN